MDNRTLKVYQDLERQIQSLNDEVELLRSQLRRSRCEERAAQIVALQDNSAFIKTMVRLRALEKSSLERHKIDGIIDDLLSSHNVPKN